MVKDDTNRKKGPKEEGEAQEKEKSGRKKAGRSKKSGRGGLGGLPSSLDDAKQVTTNQDSGVARSMGGLAVAPAMQQMPGMPGFIQPGTGPRFAHAGAKLAPTAAMIAPPTGLGGKSKGQGGRSKASATIAPPTAAAPYGWKFDDVPTLPEFHPLERTAVFVPRSSAPEVAKRVSDVLRSRSIATVYDDKKAKAKCTTEDNVEFRVRLYRGRGKFDHGVIVEVQRRYGFSTTFHEDMYAILDAAEGKKAKPAPMAKPALPDLDKLPVVSDADDMDDDDDEPAPSAGDKRKAGAASLRIASDMLKRSRTADANVLALESLASLTDPARMGGLAALRVSRQILAGSDEAGEDVREAVVSLLVDNTLKGVSQDDAADVWEDDDQGMSELRLLAMTVLMNAVSVVAASGSPALLKDQKNFLAEDVMPVLADALRESKTDQRMAVASARCLKALITSRAVGRDMSEAAIETDLIPALETSRDVGRRGNNNLAEVSSDCLRVLGSS